MRRDLRLLARSTRGASLVQYIVLVGVVALLAMAGFKAFGTSLYSQSRTYGEDVLALQATNGSRYCFVAGTPIVTPDGLRPIESIAPGDLVFTAPEDGGAIAIGRASSTSVTPDAPLVEVRLREDDAPIVATPGHPFHTVDRGWIEARALAAGEPVDGADGALHVASVRTLARRGTVYNFEVDGTHTYFVGARGAWVHNPTDCNGNPIGMPGAWPETPAPSGGDSTASGGGSSGGSSSGSWLLDALGMSNMAGLRASYVQEVEAIGPQAQQMLADGKSEEEVARWAHAERRRIGLKYKGATPLPGRTLIYGRNYWKYGDTLGPSIDYLHDVKGKSWADIIASSSTAGGQDLGLQSSAPAPAHS